MTRRLANFLRGIGSVLEIWPPSDREITRPLYTRASASPEDAIHQIWARVGDDLIAAAGWATVDPGDSAQR
jgi:hypothetical protein